MGNSPHFSVFTAIDHASHIWDSYTSLGNVGGYHNLSDSRWWSLEDQTLVFVGYCRVTSSKEKYDNEL